MIELLVVLAITAIISGTVLVSMGPALRDARLRTGCRTVMAALKYARSHAVTERTDTRVVFEDDGGVVQVAEIVVDDQGEDAVKQVSTPAGRRHRLPDGVKVLSVTKPEADEEENWISFTELGAAEDALIEVGDTHGSTRIILVDAVTGRCEIRGD